MKNEAGGNARPRMSDARIAARICSGVSLMNNDTCGLVVLIS
jgi:hypothetical protein